MGGLHLPSVVFSSKEQEEVGLLNKAAPRFVYLSLISHPFPLLRWANISHRLVSHILCLCLFLSFCYFTPFTVNISFFSRSLSLSCHFQITGITIYTLLFYSRNNSYQTEEGTRLRNRFILIAGDWTSALTPTSWRPWTRTLTSRNGIYKCVL